MTSIKIQIDQGDPEPIRKRPAMYIGDTGASGLHYLAFELIQFCFSEFQSGNALATHVLMHADGSLTVGDDGRGISIEPYPGMDISTLDWELRFGGGRTYFHGVGVKAVLALSDWAEAVTCWQGRQYRQRYERGLPVGVVNDCGSAGTATGKRIRFHPDPSILRSPVFEWGRLEARLRELAFLNKGLITQLGDESSGREETYHYLGGVADFVTYLHNAEERLHSPIHIDKALDGIAVEVAMLFRQGSKEHIRCYANNLSTAMGGTHLTGFRAGLTRTLNRFGAQEELITQDLKVTGKDFRAGLTAVISVSLPEPLYEGSTRSTLNNPEVEGVVARVVQETLGQFLTSHRHVARRIIGNAIAAAKARCNARDIHGRPFCPTTLEPAWLRWNDGVIPRLAQSIRDDSTASMPILADALEEAGCTSADVLNHCTRPNRHHKGCWVLNWLLAGTSNDTARS